MTYEDGAHPSTASGHSLLDQLKEREQSGSPPARREEKVASGVNRILMLSPSLSPCRDGQPIQGERGSKSPNPSYHHYADKATQTRRLEESPVLYRSPPLLPRLNTEVHDHPPHAYDDLHHVRHSPSPVSYFPHSDSMREHDHPARFTSTRYQPARNPYRREFYPTPVTVTDTNPIRLPHIAPHGPYPVRQLDRSSSPHPMIHHGRSPPSADVYPRYHRSQHFRAISEHHIPSSQHARYHSHPYERPRTSTQAYNQMQTLRHPYHTPPQMDNRAFVSPSSDTTANEGFKPPRKRTDDSQLQILIDVFEETAYPTTEEREYLAKKLGMTSRSVQIWFQNRRRAVKVDRQSAVQRAEAGGGIAREALEMRLGGELGFGGQTVGRSHGGGSERCNMDVSGGREWVKREVISPRGGVPDRY